jgi:hypothetical protein
MADSGGDALHHRITENTPIKTGNLRSSFYRLPTEHIESRYESHVRTEVDYAPYVNYGTGLWGPEHRKYLIEPIAPKRALSWIDPVGGNRVYAGHVWHPGSPGAHMIENGAAKVEAEVNEILAGDLQTFKIEMEAQAVQAQVALK